LTARCLLVCTALLVFCLSAKGQIAVRHQEGLVRGFLVLRSEQNETLAHGELMQEAHGNRVTAHLVFRFKDGSVRDEAAVYSQLKTFRLLKYKLEQKGPSFPHPESVSIDVPAGQVNVRYTNDDGAEKVETAHMAVPPDLANGILFTILKNGPFEGPQAQASMIVTTPKPRIVKLEISADGEDPILVGGEKHKATHYRVKIKVGGIYGLAASLSGKQPPDIQVWILPGSAPAFIKSSGALYADGPIWQIELESPVWPKD
jgi:hypothetical protein